ncbi:alpha/beta hydrolase family protein [Sandaracinus amylolyticus]|uniref:Dipeptidyl aminopeptidases/acylaminoacyl-peptidases-like protein n=1 Tax=Sandaracinus amylolyticus TaxID=927083 RepID=A0A0F6YMQ3_9BACT|nr:alpha/beta fold hydrolase [Sandaracinus amylolyticus]AKF10966.1 Dipeptidyl aminopeptidases/acylaminoacyl-peptidases-like protein [Sandaracinus amylolyticus]
MNDLDHPSREPRRPLAPVVVGAIVLGGAGALAASSFGALPAIVTALGAALVGGLGALAIASGRRALGIASIVLGLGALACCGTSGLAYRGVQSLVPDAVALEPVAAGDRRWLRHPTLGFLVGDPGEGWQDASGSPVAAGLGIAMSAVGASEGTWMWTQPEFGANVLVAAVRPHAPPTPENARAFLEGAVTGGLRRETVELAPSRVRWDDERREIWARAHGMRASGPLGVSARYLAWIDASAQWHALIVLVTSHPDDDWTSFLLDVHTPGERWRGPGVAPPGFEVARETLLAARAAHTTELVREVASDVVPPAPGADWPFELVRYESRVGPLAAYLSRGAAQLARGEERRPAVLWLHGGFSIDEGPESVAFALAEAGIVVMAPTLRGEDGNPGRLELFLGEVDDARAALDHLRALPTVDPERVVVMGHSVGGTLALMLAETHAPARAFVSFGPMADTVDLNALFPDEQGAIYDARRVEESWVRSPLAFLADLEAPTFVVEGELGNAAQARALAAAAPAGSPLRVIVAEGDHFDLVAPVVALLTPRLRGDAPIALTQSEVDAIAAQR